MKPSVRIRLGALGLLVVLACGVALHQAFEAAKIRKAMDAETAGLEGRVSAGRAAEGRLGELREETASAKQELDRLLETLPDCGRADAELDGIRSRAASAGLEATATGTGVVPKDFYAEQRLSVHLRGEEREIDAFLEAPGGRGRLAHVEVLERGPGTTTVVVTLFCFIDAPAHARAAPPTEAPEADGVWLPPFRQGLEQRRRALAGLRSEVARLAPVLREVDEYRDRKARLQTRRELVNHLRGLSPGPKRE